MIKRLFPMLLTVLLLCTTVYAAEPEPPEGVTITDITEYAAATEYALPQYYPIDIQTKTEDGVKLLLKTFEVSTDILPSALIEAGLIQNGVEYELRDILRNTSPDGQEKKTVQKSGVTLALCDVKWSPSSDYDPNPASYSATAFYKGSANGSRPSGYTADDGSIGLLSIPKLNLSVNVFETDDEMEAMSHGLAHYKTTSAWSGNIGLCGHNADNVHIG